MVFAISTLTEFATRTVANGYVVTLAVICMLQYAVHMHRLWRARRDSERLGQEITGLETALGHVQKERTLTRFENQILREFVTQSECDKAMGLLLRRFLPDPADGFAAFLRLNRNQVTVLQSRGLTSASIGRLMLDDSMCAALQQNKSVLLDAGSLQHSGFYSKLAQADRGKLRHLFLFPVYDGPELLAVFLTTELYPAGAERQQQAHLAERLMISIACSLKHKLILEQHQTRLHWTTEMLELRALADQRIEPPLRLLEDFLRTLTEKIGADQAALFLAGREPGRNLRALVRCGDSQHSGLREQALKHKETLGRAGLAAGEPLSFDSDGLARLGIDSLIGSALVIPLPPAQGTHGVVCFTKPQREEFGADPRSLAVWGVEYLQGTIQKLVSQADTERKARLDGLTQIANRRTFDEGLARELALTRQLSGTCSLLLFDLDHFKSVNDTYGHRAGDQVLRETARMIQEQVSRTRNASRALVARYGGEEIAILLPEVPPEGAARIAESIRAGIESLTVVIDGLPLQITASGGAATFPQHADSLETFVAAADAALYQSKRTGRNRVTVAPFASRAAHSANVSSAPEPTRAGAAPVRTNEGSPPLAVLAASGNVAASST